MYTNFTDRKQEQIYNSDVTHSSMAGEIFNEIIIYHQLMEKIKKFECDYCDHRATSFQPNRKHREPFLCQI